VIRTLVTAIRVDFVGVYLTFMCTFKIALLLFGKSYSRIFNSTSSRRAAHANTTTKAFVELWGRCEPEPPGFLEQLQLWDFL